MLDHLDDKRCARRGHGIRASVVLHLGAGHAVAAHQAQLKIASTHHALARRGGDGARACKRCIAGDGVWRRSMQQALQDFGGILHRALAFAQVCRKSKHLD